MKKTDRLELYKRAEKKWTQRSQLEMAQEESTELALACRKFIRQQNDTTFQKLCNEVADVEIMIEQLKMMYPSIETVVPNIKDAKLARLKERLDNNSFEDEENI